jgi:hypothetical protein
MVTAEVACVDIQFIMKKMCVQHMNSTDILYDSFVKVKTEGNETPVQNGCHDNGGSVFNFGSY